MFSIEMYSISKEIVKSHIEYKAPARMMARVFFPYVSGHCFGVGAFRQRDGPEPSCELRCSFRDSDPSLANDLQILIA